MTAVKLHPDSPLLENYLAAAASNHPGHKQLDLAVWYAILQNYANRHCMVFGRRAFRVHFLLVAPSNFGKSSSLEYGFHKFLPAYLRDVNESDDPHFVYLGGQNTAAGLTDTFNHAADEYERQVATAWVHETTQLFGGIGRFHQDLVSFFANILNGIPNIRRVREKIHKGADRVANPVVNAVFPAAPEQYGQLMKSSSSSLLKQFLLVAPPERDRHDPSFDALGDADNLAQDTFAQWLNCMESQSGIPKEPKRIGIDDNARKLFESRFAAKNKANAEERNFYASHKEQVLLLSALNALTRTSWEVSEEDADCAWNFVTDGYNQQHRLEELYEDDGAGMTPAQRTRSTNIQKVLKLVQRADREGIGRDDIAKRVYALKHGMTSSERDELFKHIEDEFGDDVFRITIETPRKDGKLLRRQLYFHTSVWTPSEAAQVLPVAIPLWSSAIGQWTDAIGGTHAQLADCFGYKPEWETLAVRPANALN